MDIGAAIAAVRDGERVTRDGWNGRGMWIDIHYPDEHSFMTLPYLYLNYPDDAPRTPGARVPWLASQTDILATDWTIV